MKKIVLSIFVIFLVVAGCKNQENKKEITSAATERPEVYASNYPLYYFAQRIAGETIDLHFPARDLSDPSNWTPVGDTIASMQSADLILVNGASFEKWLMTVTLPAEKVVNTSHSFEEQLLASGSSFTHSHGDEGEHAHEGTAFTTWMNLALAVKQAEQVKNALVQLQPEKQQEYDNNYNTLATELMNLHNAFQQSTAQKSKMVVAFSHPVYQYLSDAYGIQGKSLHWEPETPLDHEMIHEVEHLKEGEGISWLIWEGEPLPENVEKLSSMGINSAVISPLGGMPEKGDFMGIMQKNLEMLKKIYGG